MSHSDKPSLLGRSLLFLRSAVHFAFMVISVTIWSLLCMLTYPLPYRKRYDIITLWTHMNLWVLERTVGLRCEVQGLENIPEQPCIVMCKHQSTWETFALQRWFTPQVWVLKRELMRLPAFGWAVALLDPVAIDRAAGAESLRQLVEKGGARLRDGRWLVVFPEGTRTAPGTRGRYRVGGAVLAEKTGFPIVPVAHNAGEYWARHQFVKKPGVIQVRIGKPIVSEGKSAQQIMAEVEAWIEGRMEEITTLK